MLSILIIYAHEITMRVMSPGKLQKEILWWSFHYVFFQLKLICFYDTDLFLLALIWRSLSKLLPRLDVLQIWIDRALSIAHDIAIERNLLLCLEAWCYCYIFLLSLCYAAFDELKHLTQFLIELKEIFISSFSFYCIFIIVNILLSEIFTLIHFPFLFTV